MIDNPGGADDGLFARNAEGDALIWDKKAGKACSYRENAITPEMSARVTLEDGRRARPVFRLMADKYLDEKYSPDAVAEATGIPASQIKSIAYQLAQTAFEEEIVIKQKWTDGKARSQRNARPASELSCHARHFCPFQRVSDLPVYPFAANLAGSVECPGGFRFNRLIQSRLLPIRHLAVQKGLNPAFRPAAWLYSRARRLACQ